MANPSWITRVARRVGSAFTAQSSSSKPLDELGQRGASTPLVNEELAERIVGSSEALMANLAVGAGPLRTRIQSHPATALNPNKIRSIFDEADLGICYNYGDFCYELLWRDGHIYASDRERRSATAGKDFRIHAANESDLARSLRDYIETCVDQIDGFDQSMYSLLSAPMVGYSVEEQIYHAGKRRFRGPSGEQIALDGMFPRTLEWVHPKHLWFDFNEDFPLLDLGIDGKVPLDPDKFIYHKATGDGIKATRGWIRPVSWLHHFKSKGIADWSVYLHLYGIPNIWARVDRSRWADPEYRAVLEKALTDFGQGNPAVLFKDMEMPPTAVSAGGNGAVHAPYIGFMNAEISKVIKGEVLTSEAGMSGNSYALSQTHQNTFFGTVKNDAIGLAGTMRGQAFRSWIRVNRIGLQNALGVGLEELLANAPRCGHAIEEETTPEQASRILSTLVNDVGLPIGESAAYRRFSYSPPRPGEKTLRGKPVVTQEGAITTGATEAAQGIDNPKAPPPAAKE